MQKNKILDLENQVQEKTKNLQNDMWRIDELTKRQKESEEAFAQSTKELKEQILCLKKKK